MPQGSWNSNLHYCLFHHPWQGNLLWIVIYSECSWPTCAYISPLQSLRGQLVSMKVNFPPLVSLLVLSVPPGMLVNIADKIQKDLGDKPLGMSVRMFLDGIGWGRKTHPMPGQPCSMAWGSGLNKEERFSWSLAFISVLWLQIQRGLGRLPPYLPCHDGRYSHTARQKENPFFPLSWFCWVFFFSTVRK